MRSIAEEEQVAAALRTLVRRVDDARAWMKKCLSDAELGPADAFDFGMHMTRLGAAMRQGQQALAARERALASGDQGKLTGSRP